MPCGRKIPVCQHPPERRLRAAIGTTAPIRSNRPNAGICAAMPPSPRPEQTAAMRPVRRQSPPRRQRPSPRPTLPVPSRINANRIRRATPGREQSRRRLARSLRRKPRAQCKALRPTARPRGRCKGPRHGPTRSRKAQPAMLLGRIHPPQHSPEPRARRRIRRRQIRPRNLPRAKIQAASTPTAPATRLRLRPLHCRLLRIVATYRAAPSWHSRSPWPLSAS